MPALAFPEGFVDKFVKFIFDNIRNMLICSSMLVASGAVYRFRALLPSGEVFSTLIAIVLGVASLALLVLNLLHGSYKVFELFSAWRRWAVVLALAVLLVDLAVTAVVVTLLSHAQLQQLSRAVESNLPAPNR